MPFKSFYSRNYEWYRLFDYTHCISWMNHDTFQSKVPLYTFKGRYELKVMITVIYFYIFTTIDVCKFMSEINDNL